MLGGVVLGSYARDVRDFDVVRVRKGNGPRVVVVNGFLSQDKDDLSEWMPAVNKKFPTCPVYHVKWESKRLSDLGQTIGNLLAKRALLRVLKKAAKKAIKRTKLGPFGTALSIFDLASNDWFVAFLNAQKTGAMLAEIIARTSDQKFVLIGHSLGAKVVYHALEVLGSKGEKRIRSAHLLGGAVGLGKKDGWALCTQAVSGNIFNYYSKNDNVLRYLYAAGTFFQSTPIGRNRIRFRLPRVRNVNVTDRVPAHLQFKPNFHRFIRGGRVRPKCSDSYIR